MTTHYQHNLSTASSDNNTSIPNQRKLQEMHSSSRYLYELAPVDTCKVYVRHCRQSTTVRVGERHWENKAKQTILRRLSVGPRGFPVSDLRLQISGFTHLQKGAILNAVANSGLTSPAPTSSKGAPTRYAEAYLGFKSPAPPRSKAALHGKRPRE